MKAARRLKAHFHWPLLWVTGALVVVGLFNLHSATYDLNRGGVSPLVWSQISWITIGATLALLLLFVDYRIFVRLAYPLYGLSLGFLVLVVFFGKTVGGNRSWLDLGLFVFQPSEFSKLALIILLARYLSDHPPLHSAYGIRELLLPGLFVLAPLSLIILGKDLGSALYFLLSGGSLLLFGGVERKILVLLLLVSLVAGGLAYRFVLSHHQRSRIEAFLSPGEDLKGSGYHILQSKITVGSGRFWGKGYLKGMHSKLLYLPEKHTDFIFPVLAEEWGFLGSMVVVTLLSMLLYFSIEIARKASDRFGVFLAAGISLILFWHAVINLGGVLGLMPLTGVTLPLLSYGGSSVMAILCGISLLLNISMRRFMF